MKELTQRRLLESGWTKDRKINLDSIKELYENRGFTLMEDAKRFLENYGMLKFNFPKKGSPFNTMAKTNFNPFLCVGKTLDKNYFDEILIEFEHVKEIEHTSFFPIGESHGGKMILMIDNSGRFFSYTDSCLAKEGDNTEEMLDCLIGEYTIPVIYNL